MKKLFLMLFCSVASLISADVTEPETGISFPSQITFKEGGKDYQLDLTGTAVRKKLIVKVYAIASYLESPKAGEDPNKQIFDPSKAKEIVMVWNRDVSPDKLQEGYREGFEKTATPEQLKQFQKEIDQVAALFNKEVHKNDTTKYRWIPGGPIQIYFNDQKAGEITNEQFMPVVWNLWFSTKSPFPGKLTQLLK